MLLQAVNEMFKKSLSVLMDEFKPLANSVATMMIEMYETTPHASILDVARQVSTTFSLKNENNFVGGGGAFVFPFLKYFKAGTTNSFFFSFLADPFNCNFLFKMP